MLNAAADAVQSAREQAVQFKATADAKYAAAAGHCGGGGAGQAAGQCRPRDEDGRLARRARARLGPRGEWGKHLKLSRTARDESMKASEALLAGVTRDGLEAEEDFAAASPTAR